ncbi:MAG: aldehyde dehydrogenase family protein, partial [Flammeovirgaceae bacterium]|nr:aldehyde dehydrogenase family protein [Flammeovirgaceae bacterium]MDW8288755.1 aldehyde dehydrogenase family protein [Flammeovirgaceae bacterium]
MNVRTINPYDGSLIAEYTSWDSSRLQESLLLAESSFRKWRKIALEERGSLMRSLSDKLLSQKHALVELISLEMGKIRSEAIAEIEKCASLCRYYAEKGATFLKEET